MPLNRSTKKVLGFADASFANNRDSFAHLGHTVFLFEKSENVIQITSKSYTSKRVTRSAMETELISFSELFYEAISICLELQDIIGRHVPVQLPTGSKCHFNVI